MLTNLQRRLTFANVVSLIALFVSLGGGVYAASKINGKKIKKESIAGEKLKPDAVTGKQVDESSLGKVPSAQSADSAQTADNAQTLAGSGPGGFVSSSNMRRWHFERTLNDADDAAQESFRIGSLELSAVCDASAQTLFLLFGRSSASQAAFDVGIDRRGGAGGTHGGLLGSVAEPITSEQPQSTDFGRQVGTMVYNAPGETITVDYALFVNDFNGSGYCNFVAAATRFTG